MVDTAYTTLFNVARIVREAIASRLPSHKTVLSDELGFPTFNGMPVLAAESTMGDIFRIFFTCEDIQIHNNKRARIVINYDDPGMEDRIISHIA